MRHVLGSAFFTLSATVSVALIGRDNRPRKPLVQFPPYEDHLGKRGPR
jgi:hypothetical protein